MREILDLQKHAPEEFPGKTIYIGEHTYLIGELLGEGGVKLVYQLINAKSGLCHFVIRIPIDQNLAYGKCESDYFSPYCGKSMYDYCKELAKMVYHYNGYSPKKVLPIWADFLDIPEFSEQNNKYNGTFMICEYLGGNGDTNTGGIYLNNNDNFLTLFKLILRFEAKKYSEVCDLCLSYLKESNPYDDDVIEKYIISKMKTLNKPNQCECDELINLTWKMLKIEPFYRKHIYIAIQVFYHFSKWNDICELFNQIRGLFYEIYSIEYIMRIIVEAYKRTGDFENANYYAKYISDNK